MTALLAIALVALLIVTSAALAIASIVPAPVTWLTLLFGLYPVVAAVLVVARHRYATGFLLLTVACWVPVALLALITIVLETDEELPPWFLPRLVLGAIAGVASIVALVAGVRSLGGSVRIRR